MFLFSIFFWDFCFHYLLKIQQKNKKLFKWDKILMKQNFELFVNIILNKAIMENMATNTLYCLTIIEKGKLRINIKHIVKVVESILKNFFKKMCSCLLQSTSLSPFKRIFLETHPIPLLRLCGINAHSKCTCDPHLALQSRTYAFRPWGLAITQVSSVNAVLKFCCNKYERDSLLMWLLLEK